MIELVLNSVFAIWALVWSALLIDLWRGTRPRPQNWAEASAEDVSPETSDE